jgi:hypothetical protein
MSNSTRITKAQLKKALEADYEKMPEEAEQAVNNASAGAIICFGEANLAGEAWRTRLTAALYEEGAAGLLLVIHETLRSARARRKRDALRKLDQYAAKRAAMLDYPTFVERDFDAGSGPTEAACKTLTLRLKGRGRRWDRPWKALRQSRLWHTYWNRERTLVAWCQNLRPHPAK